jgi:hypothetical protein
VKKRNPVLRFVYKTDLLVIIVVVVVSVVVIVVAVVVVIGDHTELFTVVAKDN